MTGATLDVEETYRALARRLEQIVRFGVRAPDGVIEDACQLAWIRLIHHAGRVRRESALPWLSRTAVREAVRLVRRERRELSLEDEFEQGCGGLGAERQARPEERLEHRERLRLLRRLPERQQRMLWLHAMGLSYVEIAARERCTRRTVERQLLRAKQAVRAIPEEPV